MRRVGSGGMAAALIMGVAVATAGGADNDVKAPAGKGLFSGLFGEKSKAQPKKDSKPIEINPQLPSPAETATAEQQRHMNALLRRMEVCDRLRLIAEQTNNEALREQAYQLEDRATQLYRRQTAGLPMAAPAPLDRDTADSKAASPAKPAREPKRTTEESPAPPARPLHSIASPARMGGSMDQREHAILNGTSMGEDRP